MAQWFVARHGEEEFRNAFNFAPRDIPRLVAALHIPDRLGEEGLMLFLMRLATPTHLKRAVRRTIAETLDRVLNVLVPLAREKLRLERFAAQAETFADAIERGGYRFWAFLYAVHGLPTQFLVLMAPNGMCMEVKSFPHMTGDRAMIREAQLNERLSDIGEYVYGFCDDHWVRGPYRAPEEQTEEDGIYEEETGDFSSLSNWDNLKLEELQAPIMDAMFKITELWRYLEHAHDIDDHSFARYYLVAALLTNAHTCLYGDDAALDFDLPTPTLENYLGT